MDIKIIKRGNPDKYKERTERFTCYECGCVFEVKVKECKKVFYGDRSSLIHKCPCCNSPVPKRYDFTISRTCIPM